MRTKIVKFLVFGIALLGVGSGGVRADQGWQGNQDGNRFIYYDVGALRANDLVGSGTRCVAVNGGRVFPGGGEP